MFVCCVFHYKHKHAGLLWFYQHVDLLVNLFLGLFVFLCGEGKREKEALSINWLYDGMYVYV